MSLLLDTHYVFALADSPGLISKKERDFLGNHDELFAISAVSIWEIRLKWNSYYASGMRKAPASPEKVLGILSAADTTWFLPLTPTHAGTTLKTQIAHKDPFDELLLAQAQSEGLMLLTRDRKLISHPLAMSVPA